MVKRKRERASTSSQSRSSSSNIPGNSSISAPENGSSSAPENAFHSFPSTSSQSVPTNGNDCDLPKQIKQEAEDPSDLTNENWQGDKKVLADRFAFIFNSEKYADINIFVGKTEQRIPAHKLILCVGSAVLDNILSKNGKCEMLMIPDIEPDIFLVLLKFLYSDVSAVTIDNVMDVLDAAKTYAVPALEKICHDYLRDNLKVSNVFLILSKAVHFDENKIRDDCLSIIDNETKEAIESDEFTSIDLNTLCLILERNSLKIKEYDLLRATLRWSEAECNRRNLTINSENRSSVLGNAIYRLRYPLLSLAEFSSCVASSGLLPDKDLVSMFLYFANKASGALPPANFIATPRSSLPYLVVDRFVNGNSFYAVHQWEHGSNLLAFSCDCDVYLNGIGLFGSDSSTTEKYIVEYSISEDMGESRIASKLFEAVESPCDSAGLLKKVVPFLLDAPLKLTKDRWYYINYFQLGPNSLVNESYTQREIAVPIPGMDQRVTFQFGEEHGIKIPEIYFTNIP
nr:PREDICTED: BTB/POZ domain-containing protein 2-like [Bemisia tabaci]